jgi:S1-C subfamily serine protease
MPAVAFRCPSCNAALRGKAELPGGTRVRCNQCDTVFRYAPQTNTPPSPSTLTSTLAPHPIAPGSNAPSDGEARQDGRKRKQLKDINKGRHTGLFIGLAIGGFAGLAAVVAVIGLWVALDRNAPAASTPPLVPVVAAGSIVAPNPVPLVNPNPVPAPPEEDARLPVDVQEKVKKATVRILVTYADGHTASACGFFEESISGRVLTNARVVNAYPPDDTPPQHIDVVLDSGEPGAKTLPARLVGVDSNANVAVLDVGLTAPPAALVLAPQRPLQDRQSLFVAAAGEGGNIVFDSSSVSGLEMEGAVASRIAFSKALGPNDSGGPVVDVQGNLRGVALQTFQHNQVDLAVTSDIVQAVLNGHCSDLQIGDPIRKDGKLTLPVRIAVVDPLKRVTRVWMQWWEGDPTDAVPSSDFLPEAGGAARRSTPIDIDPVTLSGHVDLPLFQMPPAGRVV